MILLLFGLVLTPWFWGTGIGTPWDFAALLGTAMGGCLLHAKFDFPFQIYSITLLFIFLAAVLSSLSKRPRGL
jgi:hypothetical protein